MRMKGHVLALALLLVPGALMAQQAATPAASPIERLLQHRTDLALTPDQVQKLEAIRHRSADRERDLVAKVTEARGVAPGVPIRTHAATPAERQALRDKGQPHMNELRQLHTQQMQEARGVLTAQQNSQAWGAGQCCGTGPGSMRRGGGQGRGGMHGYGQRAHRKW